MLYTEHNQTEGLEYDGGPYHFDLRPGDIFQQHDPSYVVVRWGGRLRATSNQTTLHLDAILENPEGAAGFDLTVVMPDNSVAERPVAIGQISTAPDGSHSIINLSSAPLPAQPMPNAEWIAIDTFITERFFQTIRWAPTHPSYHVNALPMIRMFAIVEPPAFSGRSLLRLLRSLPHCLPFACQRAGLLLDRQHHGWGWRPAGRLSDMSRVVLERRNWPPSKAGWSTSPATTSTT
jgi:hypothetical protein